MKSIRPDVKMAQIFLGAAVACLSAVASAQQPEMAHLSLTGKANELSLDFVIHNKNCSGAGVQIGQSPNKLTFIPSYACDNFTDLEMQTTWLSRVLLTNLVVGTKYYYVVGSEISFPWSRVYDFVYGSGQTREGGPIYAAVADFGFYNDESLGNLMEEAYEGNFDYVLHAGDYAYNFQDLQGLIGDEYMRSIEPIVSMMPYMGIPGNHEDFENYTHYRMRFASVAEQAGVNSGSGTNMFYSFNEGLVHFIMWNSEAWWSQPVDSQTAMMNWMKADLAAANANRAAVPWVIAVAHKLWYMDDSLNTPTGAGAAVWQLLTAAGVDLQISGHIHEYQRSLPMYPNAGNGSGVVDTACNVAVGNATNPAAIYTNPKYMVSLLTAAPGDQEVNAWKAKKLAQMRAQVGAPAEEVPTTTHCTRKGIRAPDAGVEASSSNYGFSKMQIVNATHLHWTFATSVPHVNSTNPTFTDDLWLIVESHGPRNSLPPV